MVLLHARPAGPNEPQPCEPPSDLVEVTWTESTEAQLALGPLARAARTERSEATRRSSTPSPRSQSG